MYAGDSLMEYWWVRLTWRSYDENMDFKGTGLH